MDDSTDDKAAVATYMLLRVMRKKRKRRRTVRVRPWIMQRFASMLLH